MSKRPDTLGLDRVVAFAMEHPWALTRPMLAVVANILARRLSAQERAMDLAPQQRAPVPPATGVAIIPIHGVIAPRMNLMSDISGGTTFESLTADLREAVASAQVGTIVLDIDSPGGSCAGATMFADQVRRAKTVKPVIAVAQFSMCSAAYWVGANATQVVAAPGSLVGSIGVFSIHEDLSRYLEEMGVTVTYLSAGKYKVDGNETEPLSDTARARIQAQVDSTYAVMVRDIALGRGVSEATVRASFGEGAVLSADDALAAGMVDRIQSLDDTIARAQTGSGALTAAATPQELDGATGQEPRQWATEVERAFVEWALSPGEPS